MKLPMRIQRRRTKGFRLPPGTLCVTRPGPWGNPFNWREIQAEQGVGARYAKTIALDMFRGFVMEPWRAPDDRKRNALSWIIQHIPDLAEYDRIACTCREDEECHGDVLLALLAQQMKETT